MGLRWQFIIIFVGQLPSDYLEALPEDSIDKADTEAALKIVDTVCAETNATMKIDVRLFFHCLLQKTKDLLKRTWAWKVLLEVHISLLHKKNIESQGAKYLRCAVNYSEDILHFEF